jgi:RNA polymerase sigma factor (sigma-70 family)
MSPRPARKPSVPAGVQPSSPRSPDLRERYRQCFPRVFAYVYGRTRDTRATEDLASEVFGRAFAEAHALPDEAAFETRLFTVARDLLIIHCRSQTPRDDAPEDDPLRRPDVARILNHVRRLALREQDIIALKFDAQLTNTQIAQVMELTERKVRAILYRTLRHISKALEREG